MSLLRQVTYPVRHSVSILVSWEWDLPCIAGHQRNKWDYKCFSALEVANRHTIQSTVWWEFLPSVLWDVCSKQLGEGKRAADSIQVLWPRIQEAPYSLTWQLCNNSKPPSIPLSQISDSITLLRKTKLQIQAGTTHFCTQPLTGKKLALLTKCISNCFFQQDLFLETKLPLSQLSVKWWPSTNVWSLTIGIKKQSTT